VIRQSPIYLATLFIIIGTIACSISGIRQQVQSAGQTADAVKTRVSGVKTAGGSLIDTAQAIETQGSGLVKTVKAITTKGAPLLSTIQAAMPDKSGMVETAQAFIEGEAPTGEPPPDIPIFNRDQAESFYGSSQYIFYISPTDYNKVLDFYKNEMQNEGWQYLEDGSHEYAHAAQLNYYKDTRTVTIDLSFNTLNDTTVIIINILSH